MSEARFCDVQHSDDLNHSDGRCPIPARGSGRRRQTGSVLDADHCYRLLQTRDRRFDGWFVTAVRTTGIYCRPSCPAVMPKRHNVEFFPTSAAAQQHGYRACKRCRPDASPGSPAWDVRGDVVARAMRLVADGVVDREGVAGLARRARLQRAPPQPGDDGGARRRPARHRPGPAGAHRPHPARDHRPGPARRRLRRRVRQRPPVQRHDPRGVRVDADRAASGPSGGGALAGRRRAARAGGARAVRRRRPPRLPRRPCRARRRALGRPRVPPGDAPASRPRRRRPHVGRRRTTRSAAARARRAATRRLARPGGRGAPGAAVARSRRRPGVRRRRPRRRRRARRRPSPRYQACVCPAASTRSRPQSGP